MSDRDELAHLIHRTEHGPHDCPYGPNDDQKAAADAVLTAGYRKVTVTPEQENRADENADAIPEPVVGSIGCNCQCTTVTPEQIEAAAKAIRDAYYEDCGIPPGSEFPTEPAEWLGEAHAAARAYGLSAALQLIDRHGCTNYTTGRCWDARRIRGAEYGADSWCDACVARAALDPTALVPEDGEQ